MTIENPCHQLQCRFSAQSASIERLLRVIRVRGFTVRDLQLEYADGIYNASMRVSGWRSIENLTRQLSKLVEVSTIFVADAPPQALEQCTC